MSDKTDSTQTTSATDKSVQNMAKETAEAAKERGETLKDKARDVARDSYQKGKEEVAARAEAARDTAADETRETGEAFREAGEHFDQGDYRRTAAVHIADTLDGVASSLRDTDLEDVRADVESFARRNPVLFYAGAALTGFALSRLMKATARADDDDDDYAPRGGQGRYNDAAYVPQDDIVDYPATARPVPPVTPGASVGARDIHGGGTK